MRLGERRRVTRRLVRAFPDDRRLGPRRGLLDRLFDRRGDLRRAGMVVYPDGVPKNCGTAVCDKLVHYGDSVGEYTLRRFVVLLSLALVLSMWYGRALWYRFGTVRPTGGCDQSSSSSSE